MNEDVAVVIEDGEDIRELLAQVPDAGRLRRAHRRRRRLRRRAVREHDPIVVTRRRQHARHRRLRDRPPDASISTAYLVMITARGDEIDTLVGLQTGADDYIVKPFRPRELRASIEAMMRRPRIDRVDAPLTSPMPPTSSEPSRSADRTATVELEHSTPRSRTSPRKSRSSTAACGSSPALASSSSTATRSS